MSAWPFDSFNASALGAFVESPLRERDAIADQYGYAMGGWARRQNQTFQLRRMDRYDFAADLWSRVARLLKFPFHRGKQAGFAFGPKGYFVGSTDRVSEFFIYQPDDWIKSKKGVPAFPASADTGVAQKNKVYVTFTRAAKPYTYQYDPAANSWERRANYPTVNSKGVTIGPLTKFIACSIGDKCYFYAGQPINNVWPGSMLIEYEPATDTWKLKANMTWELYLSAGGELDGEAYLQGGETDDMSTTAGALSYLPSTDTWRVRLPGLQRQDHDAFTLSQVDSSIFLVCGSPSTRWKKLMGDITEFNSKRNSWTEKHFTATRAGHVCWAI